MVNCKDMVTFTIIWDLCLCYTLYLLILSTTLTRALEVGEFTKKILSISLDNVESARAHTHKHNQGTQCFLFKKMFRPFAFFLLHKGYSVCSTNIMHIRFSKSQTCLFWSSLWNKLSTYEIIKINIKIQFMMNLIILILYCGYWYISKRHFDNLLEIEWFKK